MKLIKKLILFLIYSWYRRGNRIYIHKMNGKIIEASSYFGLTVRFKGNNNIIDIYEPLIFKRRLFCNRSLLKISGNNNKISVQSSKKFISYLKLYNIGSNNIIDIGKNWFQSGFCKIDFCNQDNKVLKIGQNCMFGQNVEIMLGDWHSVIDIKTKECLNKTRLGVIVGNNVWIARDVKILKDVIIPDESIIGIGSIVTKAFNGHQLLIAGNPAKKIKDNITWTNKNPK